MVQEMFVTGTGSTQRLFKSLKAESLPDGDVSAGPSCPSSNILVITNKCNCRRRLLMGESGEAKDGTQKGKKQNIIPQSNRRG